MGRNDANGPASFGGLWGDAPISNAGDQMWAGSDGTWAGFTQWPRVKVVLSGHDIDGYTSGWIWQHNTRTSAKGQAVEEIFCNCQDGDKVNYCSGDPTMPNGTSDVAHLFLLRIWPTTMEAFLVSTNSGKWSGASGVVQQTDPVQLFSVPFVGRGSKFVVSQ